MTEYISISEFAKLANVTTQAVYKRINKDLSSYCKTVDGRKTIRKDALSLYEYMVVNKTNEVANHITNGVANQNSVVANKNNGIIKEQTVETDENSSEDSVVSRMARNQNNDITNHSKRDGNVFDGVANHITNQSNDVDNQNDVITNEFATYLKSENERLIQEVDRLQQVIEKKDCLTSEKDRQIADYAERFAELASREQEISARALQNGQALQVIEEKQSWWKRIFR